MHKKHHVRMTAADIEEGRGAIARGDWEQLEKVSARLERRKQWDEQHPSGEGNTVEKKKVLRESGYQWVDEPCTYQWVRVTNDKNKVLGTFYIRHHEGDISELFLAPARKGMSPNPYDESLMSRVRWEKRGYEQVRRWEEEMVRRSKMTPEERHHHMSVELEKARKLFEFNRQRYGDDPQDLEAYHREVEGISKSWDGTVNRETRPMNTDTLSMASATGLSEAHKVPGQRPTLGVQPTTDLSGDVRFTFRDGRNGFPVRGSLLGPVLLGFRQHYGQHVNLSMVRAGVNALASNKRNGL